MKSFLEAIVKERRIVIFLTIIVSIIGLISYNLLPKQESPDVSVPAALIITPYPGASSRDVDELVSSKIEEELKKIEGYDYSISNSQDSVSVITVLFNMDIDPDKASQNVRYAVEDAKSNLPSGVGKSIINTNIAETAGILISLSGENYTYEQLASFGDKFKLALTDVEGISKFSIEGEVEKEVKVEVDSNRLNQLNISLVDLSQILQVQNLEIPSGNLEIKGNKIKVKTSGSFESLKDIEETVVAISKETGISTRLKDIAKVSLEVKTGVEKFKENSKNAVLLTGYFEKGKNVVIVGKEVRKIIDNVKKQLPEDLIISEVVYQPEDVKNSVNDFMLNLLEGIVLVIIVVFLGMGLRNSLVVSTAIPISILITFIVMSALKIEIHQMSLTALIISLGILVDNAIVMSDTIQVRIDKLGEDPKVASIKGARMSRIPILVATITTVAAFSPLLGLPGAAGKFLIDIPKVLIISILAAYFMAMVIMPAMSAEYFVKTKKKMIKESKIRKFFQSTLKYSLKRKKKIILSAFTVFIIVIIFVLPMLPSEFFPYVDKDIMYIDIKTETVGNMEATESVADKVTKMLLKEPEITDCTVAIGDGLPKFYISMLPAKPSSNFAQVLCKIDIKNVKNRRFKNRKQLVNYVQKQLDQNLANGKAEVKLLENAYPKPKISMRISGEDLDIISDISNKVKDKMTKIQGISNVHSDKEDQTLQIEVDVDEDKAMNLGVSKYDIQMQINIALYGKTPSVYRKSGKEYDIVLKSNIDDINKLENMNIKSSLTKNKIPLKQLADIKYGRKTDNINRYRNKKTVTITADALDGFSPVKIEDEIENNILSNIDTTGTEVVFDGEREMIKENFGILKTLALGAIFAIYIILIVQFNSFVTPIVILMTVPLSLIGSIIGLFIFRQPLSLTAMLGIIALIGLVVKNGILLIEYINDAKKDGMNSIDACVDAVDKRFNAIILSALTTILGLLPLALSGSSLFAPMAISLMAGLTVSTFLTMVIIPVIYAYIDEKKNKNLV